MVVWVMLEEMLKLVKKQPVAFGIEAGFTDLTTIHNEWIKSFLYSKNDVTLQAHRRKLQDYLLNRCNGIDDSYLS